MMRLLNSAAATVFAALPFICCARQAGEGEPGGAVGQGGAIQSSLGGANPMASGGSGGAGSSITSAAGGSSTVAQGGKTNTSTGGSTSSAAGGAAQGGKQGSGGSASSFGGLPPAQGGDNGVGGACAALDATAKPVPPVLEFVVDTTGSMDSSASTATSGVSKWQEMQRVLPKAFRSLPTDWAVGLSFYDFGKLDKNQCFVGEQHVAIAPLTSTQLTALENAVTGRATYSGGTPTYNAWKFGLDQVTGWTATAAYQGSTRHIVLITDGIPTVNNTGCSDSNTGSAITKSEYDALIANIKNQGAAAKVTTFVVGVLGSQDPQDATYDPLFMLSQSAIAGGTEQPKGCVSQTGVVSGGQVNPRGKYCHFDMTTNPDFAAGLTEALKSISSQVMSCSFDVPEPSDGRIIDPNKVVVSLLDSSGNAQELSPKASSSACQDGKWYFAATGANGRPSKIDICPNTCSELRGRSGQTTLKITFTCYEPG